MDLLNLAVRIGVNDEASDKLEGISAGAIAKATVMGQAMYDAVKFGVSKIADAAKELVTGALDGYSAYEQLSGGIEKLYGNAGMSLEEYADSVGKTTEEVAKEYKRNEEAQADLMNYAQNAYKTAGMSANEYMEKSTQFSASLIKSLGGDTKEAARLTDVAMRAISDNVNTFGSDAESATNAIIGLSRQNYTMLDNLKLGYSGTAEGMMQLINDSGVLGKTLTKTSELSSVGFDKMVEAIQRVQEQQGIAGTTAREAMTTIEGSVNAAKASWENLLTAIGSGDPEMIGNSVTGLIDSIFGTFNEEVGKREGGVINNVLPVIQNVGTAIVNEMPAIAQQVYDEFFAALGNMTGIDFTWLKESISETVDTVTERIEALKKAAEDFVSGFTSSFDLQGAQDALNGFKTVLDSVWAFINDNILANSEAIGSFLGNVGNVLTTIATAATDLMTVIGPYVPFIATLVGAFGVLMPIINGIVGIVGAISGAVTFLTTVVGPAIGMIGSVQGAVAALVTVLGGPITIIAAIGAAIIAFIATNEEAREAIVNAWNAVVDFFMHIPENAQKAWDDFKSGVENMIKGVSEKWEGFKSKVGEWMDGIKSGIEEKWNAVVEWVTGIPQRITDALGDLGNLLWNAGTSIIDGLLGGMKQMADDMFGWVGSIADTISNLKGPLPYDRKVLVDNGKALMTGLKDGIEQGFEQEVKPAVKAVAKGIDTYYGTLSKDTKDGWHVANFHTVDAAELVARAAREGYERKTGNSGSWITSSNNDKLYSAAFQTTSSQRKNPSEGRTQTAGSRSSVQYVRDEGAINMLKAIYSKMQNEPELNTRKLAHMLAPDMNKELGRL